jgi:SAM-dependent methyltransferase
MIAALQRVAAAVGAPFRDDRSARRHLLDRDLQELTPLLRGRVLEVGNGRRGRRGRFTPPAGAEAWVYLDVAIQTMPHVCADVQRLPFADAAFDTIICLEVLEYVPRADAALEEMSRVLRRNGALVVSTPFNTRPDTMTDFWRFTAHGLTHMVTSAGMKVTRLSAQGNLVSVILHMLRVLNGGSAWRRRLIAWSLTPAFLVLLALDWRIGRRGAAYGYTTGYVLVAVKPEHD